MCATIAVAIIPFHARPNVGACNNVRCNRHRCLPKDSIIKPADRRHGERAKCASCRKRAVVADTASSSTPQDLCTLTDNLVHRGTELHLLPRHECDGLWHHPQGEGLKRRCFKRDIFARKQIFDLVTSSREFRAGCVQVAHFGVVRTLGKRHNASWHVFIDVSQDGGSRALSHKNELHGCNFTQSDRVCSPNMYVSGVQQVGQVDGRNIWVSEHLHQHL